MTTDDVAFNTVARLIRQVGRAFYRDEHVAILDVITREHYFIREDRLEDYFAPLRTAQVKKILGELEKSKLVCSEFVTEHAVRKKDREDDDAMMMAETEQKLNEVKRQKMAIAGQSNVQDNVSQPAETIQNGGQQEDQTDDKNKTIRDQGQKTVCWYINPRYAVDAIRYRLYLMRKKLREEESTASTLKTYKCPTCGYEATSSDVAQLLLATDQARRMNSLNQDFRSRRRPENASTAPACPAPNCNSILRNRDMRRLRDHSSSKLDRFDALLEKHSNIKQLLDELKSVRLGANRPSDHVFKKQVTLKDPSRINPYGSSNSSRSSSSRASGIKPFRPGVYTTRDRDVEVRIHDGADSNGSSEQNVDNTVSIETAPAILTKSAYTGKRAQSLGFHHIESYDANDKDHSDDDNKDGEEQDALFEFLDRAIQGDSDADETTEEKPLGTTRPEDDTQVQERTNVSGEGNGGAGNEEEWESGDSESESDFDSESDTELEERIAKQTTVKVGGVEQSLFNTSEDDPRMSNEEFQQYQEAVRQMNREINNRREQQ